MGFVWLGTIPLTSAAIARRFGVADLGALYGVCFLSHQLGGFLGAGPGAVLLEYGGQLRGLLAGDGRGRAGGDGGELDGEAAGAAWP